MPSIAPRWRLPFAILAVAILAYAFVVAGNLLFGVFLVAVVYLFGWLVTRVSDGNPLDDVTRARAWATGLIALSVLVYATLIAANLLLGAIAAVTVALVSWVTSPIGPVARWLDRR